MHVSPIVCCLWLPLAIVPGDAHSISGFRQQELCGFHSPISFIYIHPWDQALAGSWSVRRRSAIRQISPSSMALKKAPIWKAVFYSRPNALCISKWVNCALRAGGTTSTPHSTPHTHTHTFKHLSRRHVKHTHSSMHQLKHAHSHQHTHTQTHTHPLSAGLASSI